MVTANIGGNCREVMYSCQVQNEPPQGRHLIFVRRKLVQVEASCGVRFIETANLHGVRSVTYQTWGGFYLVGAADHRFAEIRGGDFRPAEPTPSRELGLLVSDSGSFQEGGLKCDNSTLRKS
jgi:hypothetical protein